MICFGGVFYTLYGSAVQFLYSGKVCDNLALHSTETVDLSWEQLPYINPNFHVVFKIGTNVLNMHLHCITFVSDF